MKITFVTKDKNRPEKWQILELEKEDNPFADTIKEGEPIPIDDIIGIVALPPFYGEKRKLQKFFLYTTLDGYMDIRYYYEHVQN